MIKVFCTCGYELKFESVNINSGNELYVTVDRCEWCQKAAQPTLAVDGAGVCRQVKHVFIEGVCAGCGAVETRPPLKRNPLGGSPANIEEI
jgi:hypothetical protein